MVFQLSTPDAVRVRKSTAGVDSNAASRSAMPSIDHTHAIVSRRGWLSVTPASFRAQVLERSLLQEYRAGEKIYALGDSAGGAYGLVSGVLGISIAPGERGPLFAHIAPPGTWIGFAAFFTEQPRQVGLEAKRDTRLLHLPLHAMREMVAADPGAWRFFGLAVVINSAIAIGAADDLLIRDPVNRCVAVLLRLAGCRERTLPGSAPIDIDVSQDEVAALANLSRTTAGAILRRFHTSQYLEVSYRRIRLLTPDALRAMLTE